jgi:hypothetical protein
MKIEWRPHPKQEKALMSTAFETLYGGARGGGKTDAGLAWLLYDTDQPDYRALVIRKNVEDLKDWVDRARTMYSGTGAEFVGKPVEIHFPSGAKIYTGHLKDENAFSKYQGHEYCRMLIEELTHIPSEEQYLKLIASCRSTTGIKPQVFATTNPGGPGHAWCKKRFIDPAPPGTVFQDKISGRSRVFIPATVEDNPTLLEKDPDYVRFLDALPADLREQWRKGNWNINIVKGAYFQADVEQASREGRITRVPFNRYQSVFVAFDLGISVGNDMVMTFFQVDNKEIKVFQCLADIDKPYGHYIQVLKEEAFKRGYSYGKIFLPHDGAKRSGDTLRSFADQIKEAGYVVEIIPQVGEKQKDIELLRMTFPRLWLDSDGCATLLDALTVYRREWVEERGVYQDKPYHDWSSNYCDCMMVLARAVSSFPSPQKGQPNNYGFKMQKGYTKRIF